MANTKGNKKLYKRMRASGVRKRVARELSALPGIGSDGKRAPKAVRDALGQLESVVGELQKHAGRGDRKAAARKAARTRRQKSAKRSSAARKGAKARSGS
jgi:hypothetical protein